MQRLTVLGAAKRSRRAAAGGNTLVLAAAAATLAGTVTPPASGPPGDLLPDDGPIIIIVHPRLQSLVHSPHARVQPLLLQRTDRKVERLIDRFPSVSAAASARIPSRRGSGSPVRSIGDGCCCS